MKLLLKTVSSEFTAYNGFQYPRAVGSRVESPDWNPVAECGGGLHWLLWGEGDGNLLNGGPDTVALVGSVGDDVPVVDLGGKVKTPSADIVFIGPLRDAAQYIMEHGGGRCAVAYGTATAGDYGTATAGDYGTATAGFRGTATAGEGGTATAGEGGTATAGEGGTATAGFRGTATAGEGGTLVIKRWDGKRYRLVVGYIGEGLKPDTPYTLDDAGKFVEKASAAR